MSDFAVTDYRYTIGDVELSWSQEATSAYLCLRHPSGGHAEAVRTIEAPGFNLDIADNALIGVEQIGSELSWVDYALLIRWLAARVDWSGQ